MSECEFSRLKVITDLIDGRLCIEIAGALMGVGRRQVFRLQRAFETRGPAGLVSGKRGKPNNRAHGATLRQTAVDLVRERYADFGPTFASEKLAELHGLRFVVETLRQLMITDELWVWRKERPARVFQPRPRRDCLCELVQIDGSAHWWFEDRGPFCTLLVYVDDATGRLMELRLVETESAFDYFQATRSYLAVHGKPVAFYSDRHGVC